MAENPNEQDKPKIIIDDDWKTQAQAEKQKLAEEVEGAAQQAQAAGAGGGAEGDRELPPASFVTLVNTLATQALMALGGFADPRSGRRVVDLDAAKFHIDTLAVLKEKTEGNLTDEESKLLDQASYEVKMAFVQMAQRVSQQMAGGGQDAAAGGAGPVGPGGVPNIGG